MDKGKKLFNYLEDSYYKNGIAKDMEQILGNTMEMYTQIINIVFVFLGIRPACLVETEDGKIPKVLNTLTNFDPKLKFISDKPGYKSHYTGKDVVYFYFINLDIIKEKGLDRQLKMLEDKTINVIQLGELLDYVCPNDIFTNFDRYMKKDDSKLNRRYVIDFIIYAKDNKEINFINRGQFYSSVCYKEKEKVHFYKDSIKKLKTYQNNIAKLTDKIHIGVNFIEEII